MTLGEMIGEGVGIFALLSALSFVRGFWKALVADWRGSRRGHQPELCVALGSLPLRWAAPPWPAVSINLTAISKPTIIDHTVED